MTIPNFNYIIEPISAQHNRDDFCCGIEALDYYLKKQAKREEQGWLRVEDIDNFPCADQNCNQVIFHEVLRVLGLVALKE